MLSKREIYFDDLELFNQEIYDSLKKLLDYENVNELDMFFEYDTQIMD